MHFAKRTWVRLFLTLLCAEALAFCVIILRRPVMTSDQWAFLEQQRPQITHTSHGFSGSVSFACADCLNYSLARRPIGGWDSPAALVETINLPASLLARLFFRERQLSGVGTSQENSDLATLVFAIGALVQIALVAGAFSIRFQRGTLSRTRDV
jgi:hypothetical protein